MTGFEDRRDAGRLLADKLERYREQPDCILLALPRGGVVVAHEIAKILRLPLDVCIVRKLGVPFQPELAMGAIAPGGVVVLHKDLIAELGIPKEEVDREIAIETEELARRERLYRGGKPPVSLRGKTVILIDDGIATGATIEAAILAIRQQAPARIVAAAAVASRRTVEKLALQADEVVCVLLPVQLSSIGEWYRDFEQVSDDEVLTLLATRETPVFHGKRNENEDR